MAENKAVENQKKEKVDFFMKDFELCFGQLKFYDDREISALRYIFLISSGVASLISTVYGVVEKTTPEFFGFISFLSLAVFITTLVLYMSALQNRVYFARTASHMNKIRDYFTEGTPLSESFYQKKRPALSWTSVHTYVLMGAALFSSMYFGLFYLTKYLAVDQTPSLKMSIIVAVIVAVVEIVGGAVYLWWQDRKSHLDLA